MNNYFTLSEDQQQKVLQAAAGKLGLPAQAIEKDLWVTTILQIVFTLPFSSKMIFKGGTSLSKVGKIINRFSEDIDLAVDRTYFGYEGDLTKRELKKLRKASSVFVRDEFCAALQKGIEEYELANLCKVEAEPDGDGDGTYPEPRKIWIEYQSVFKDSLEYIKPIVMLEISARSLHEPYEVAKVKSLVEENYPNIQTSLVESDIITAKAEKTFLEKVFLLHELFSIEGHGVKADRKSRHLYDLYMMMDKDFAKEAIKDDVLWENIRHHREIFTSVRDMDYTPDIRKRLVLVPREDIIEAWATDYAEMRESMIHGKEKPTFQEILEKMTVLQSMFKDA